MRKGNIKLPPRRAAATAVLLAALLAGPAHGAQRPEHHWRWQPADAATILPADATPAPSVRRPAAERLYALREQREFQYVEGKPEEPGFWDRFKEWFWRWFSELFSTRGGRTTGRTLYYGLLGAALVFAVLKLLQIDLTNVFGRAPRTLPLAYEAGQENIHELNFAEALAQAEAAGNLRLAVRLGYLQLLKQLTDRMLIDWQPNKTNQTYLGELAANRPAARPAFAELTRQFEYAWYGEVAVPARLYRQVRDAQVQFGQQLSGAGQAARLA